MPFSRLPLTFRSNARKALEELEPHMFLLERIIDSTERDFLVIGEKLQVFRQEAEAISSKTSEIAGTVSGREMEGIREGFDRLSSMAAELSGGMEREREDIADILHHFESLEYPLESFRRIVRNLHALGNYLRIELAHLTLEDTSFQKLAEDVRSLASQIEAKTGSLHDEAKSADPLLRRNIRVMEHSDGQRRARGTMISEKVGQDLSVISDRSDASREAIQDISKAWNGIAGNVESIVLSMQFHDITRQRVEHALQVLRELPGEVAQMSGEGLVRKIAAPVLSRLRGPRGKPSLVTKGAFIADVFMLQVAQLRSADADLGEAVEGILDNLRGVSKDAMAMSGKIHSLLGTEAGEGGSFIGRMEEDIALLREAVEEIVEINKQVAREMTGLSETAESMSRFAGDMERISIDMQRLAINARVHAAHIGDSGATLGVLADSLHGLSSETAERVEKVNGCLALIVQKSASLASHAAEENVRLEARLGEGQDYFEGMMQMLRKIETTFDEGLPRVEKSGEQLSGEVEGLVSSVHVHERIHDDIEKTATHLQARAERLVKGMSRDEGAPGAHLEGLSAKYTMHRERQTHLAAVGPVAVVGGVVIHAGTESTPPAPQEIAADPSQPDSEGDDDFGDNVELF